MHDETSWRTPAALIIVLLVMAVVGWAQSTPQNQDNRAAAEGKTASGAETRKVKHKLPAPEDELVKQHRAEVRGLDDDDTPAPTKGKVDAKKANQTKGTAPKPKQARATAPRPKQ